MNNAVDAVITWVNGEDKEWLCKRSQYDSCVRDNEGKNPARYRDWDTLKYVIRGIEKNLSWIRHIYLVTDHQLPTWYQPGGKVIVVDHKEYIPHEYLPTFSSHTIENNIYRIHGISDQFIYFNDDTIILHPMKKEDFFLHGKVRDCASLHIHCVKKSLMIYQISNNDISLINEHFNIAEVLRKNKSGWLNIKYGLKRNLKTIILSNSPRFPGIEQFHMPQAYLKRTFETVWQKEYDVLDETCRHKFRHKNDVNQWLFRDWQLANGDFVPVSPKHRGILIDFEKNDEKDELKKCLTIIRGNSHQMICINDGDTIQDVETIRTSVINALEEKFPEKAACEK